MNREKKTKKEKIKIGKERDMRDKATRKKEGK